MTPAPRIDVVGTGISAVTMSDAVDRILHPPETGHWVAVCTVHGVMTARRNPELRRAFPDAYLATPDGMPLVWALRAMGSPGQERVDGHHLFEAAVEAGLEEGARHFFYGSTAETLAALTANLADRYPSVEIVGALSPPFRAQTATERADDLETIRAARPDVVWVGLGLPKQELWMVEAQPELPGMSLVGIGAVFDWVAGSVAKAPMWMQRSGLEWLYRLAREPRRLWRRYAWNNPAYLALLGAQILRFRLSRARS